MDEIREQPDVLQAWLDKLRATNGADFDLVRGEVIKHAGLRLEALVRKILKNYPRLRRWEQTGDVLQNSLIRLHHAMNTIRPDSPRHFFGLAAVQIRRELIDMTRHHFGPQGAANKHHTDGNPQNSRGISSVELQADTQGEPLSLLEWTEFHEAVERLPDAEREVFDLYWYEGFDQKAVAALLNVTDRTVKNRWRNAKLLLRDLLADRNT